MRWVSHIAIAGAVTALANPLLVPAAMLGATAPDWLEWVITKLNGYRLKHRGPTHYVSAWGLAVLFFSSGLDFRGVGLAFALGGLSHVLCDALTVTGVPFGPWSDRRFHLFGGRLRTGAPGEYAVTLGVVLVCALIGWQLRGISGEFSPFFPDYAGMYRDGLLDAKEWKERRLQFF